MSTVIYERHGLKVSQCGDGPGRTRLEIVAGDPTILDDVMEVWDLGRKLQIWACSQEWRR